MKDNTYSTYFSIIQTKLESSCTSPTTSLKSRSKYSLKLAE